MDLAPEIVKFANPFLICVDCLRDAEGHQEGRLWPCGHVADTYSTCLTWGPVGGCRCGPFDG